MHSPDYRDMNKDQALNDFIQRIEHYKQTYEALDEDLEKHLSFIKIFNAGEKVLVHRHVSFHYFESCNDLLIFLKSIFNSRRDIYKVVLYII